MTGSQFARVAFECCRASTGLAFGALAVLKLAHPPPTYAAPISIVHFVVTTPALYYTTLAIELAASVMIAKGMRSGFLLGGALTIAFAALLALEATSGVFLERCGCFGALSVHWKTRVCIVASMLVLTQIGYWTCGTRNFVGGSAVVHAGR